MCSKKSDQITVKENQLETSFRLFLFLEHIFSRIRIYLYIMLVEAAHNHVRYGISQIRTGRCKGHVFSALAAGQLHLWGPFFVGKMHGTFMKHCNLQHFWTQTASSNFVARIVTNNMSILGAVWQLFCDLTPS